MTDLFYLVVLPAVFVGFLVVGAAFAEWLDR